MTAIFYTALKYGAFVRRKDGRIDKSKGTAHRDNLSGSRDERSLCLGDDDDGDLWKTGGDPEMVKTAEEILKNDDAAA